MNRDDAPLFTPSGAIDPSSAAARLNDRKRNATKRLKRARARHMRQLMGLPADTRLEEPIYIIPMEKYHAHR